MSLSQTLSQPDYHPTIQAFRDWIRKTCAPGIIDPSSDSELELKFLPTNTLEDYFKSDGYRNLAKLLKAVYYGEPPVREEEIARKYSRVFGILILIGKAEFIATFVSYDNLRDACLPFSFQEPPAHFPDTYDGELLRQFCENQWIFCAPVLDDSTTRKFDDRLILPVILKEKLASGGSARLYKIILQDKHNNLRPIKTAGDLYTNTFVLKTYYGKDAETYYRNEVSAFKRLRLSSGSSIIGFYGSFIHGNRYNVVLEFADKGSLESYFRTTGPPAKGEDIIGFWEGLFKVIAAVMALHSGDQSSDGSRPLQGWHQDIKPENILVTSRSETIKSAYRWEFRLADLGISHFKRQISTRQDNVDKDTWGTRTYGAPECHRPDDVMRSTVVNVTQKVDIWSIGAVFSEAAVWVVEGYRGLERYRQLRQEATGQIAGFEDGNCFHDGEQMLDIVRTQHRDLEDCFRSQDAITSAVLAMIEDMLVDANARPNAIQIWTRSQRILQNARDKLEKPAIRDQQTSTAGRERRRPLVEPPEFGAESEFIPDKEGQNMSPYGQGMTSKELSTPDKNNPPGQGLHGSRIAGVPKSYASPSSGWQFPTGVKSQHVQKASQGVPSSDTKETDLDQYQPPTPSFLHKMDSLSLTQNDPDYSDDIECYDYDDSKDDEVLQDAVSSDKKYRASAPLPRSKYASVDLSKPKYRSEPPDLTEQVGRRKTDISSRSIHSERHHMPPSKAATSYITNGLKTQMKDISEEGSPNFTSTAPSGTPPSSSTFQTPIESSSRAPVPPPDEKKRRELAVTPKLSRIEAVRWKDEKKQGRHSKLHGDWLFHRLNQRDHVFIIDDAESMRPYWSDMTALFSILAYMVKHSDPDGLDMCFTIDSKKYNSRHTTNLVNALDSKGAQGSSNITFTLDSILNEYKTRLRSQTAQRSALSWWKKEVRPLNLYILTDGVWQPKCDVFPAIKNLVDLLVELKLDEKQVGIQFISFGNDSDGLNRLERLDSGLNLKLDIVDTTPSSGDIWKMLLGAIDKDFDDDPPPKRSATDDSTAVYRPTAAHRTKGSR